MNERSKFDIEIKSTIASKIFFAVIMTISICLITYAIKREISGWKNINIEIIISLCYLLAAIICLFFWIKVIDNNSEIRINKDGIWLRKTILPFSELILIYWNEINSVVLETKKDDNGKTNYLTIYPKVKVKRRRFDIASLDQCEENILLVIREYFTIINFKDRTNIRN